MTKFEECWSIHTGEGLAQKQPDPIVRRVTEQGWVRLESRQRRGNNPHRGRGRVCERDMVRVRVGHGIAGQNYCVIGGCLLSLSLCRRGFQDLLKVRPSSLLILCGYISSSIASLMSRSMYPLFEPNLLPYGYPNNPQIQSFYTYLPVKVEQTECSETSAYKVQKPGNYPEENIQQKSAVLIYFTTEA